MQTVYVIVGVCNLRGYLIVGHKFQHEEMRELGFGVKTALLKVVVPALLWFAGCLIYLELMMMVVVSHFFIFRNIALSSRGRLEMGKHNNIQ